MRVIQATIPILYRSVDMNGMIVDCNQAYADRLGYAVEEIVGKSLFEYSTKDTREALRKAFVDWTVSQKTNIPHKDQTRGKEWGCHRRRADL